MTDSNTTRTDYSDVKSDIEVKAPQTMSQLLPLVARRLKSHGVAQVCARYEGAQFVFIFLSREMRTLPSLSAMMTAREITAAFRSILERRYPGALTRDDTAGFLEWDLNADTLRHEHAVTHRGL